MKNKGFSLVELLVVIAILAILVGALTPLLIKYINKSRLSSDITTGRQIASAIMAIVVEEEYRNDAQEFTQPHKVSDMKNDTFKAAVLDYLAVDTIPTKSLKDIDGNRFQDPEFFYTLDSAKNKVEIYYGGTTADYQIYPVTGKKLTK